MALPIAKRGTNKIQSIEQKNKNCKRQTHLWESNKRNIKIERAMTSPKKTEYEYEKNEYSEMKRTHGTACK